MRPLLLLLILGLAFAKNTKLRNETSTRTWKGAKVTGANLLTVADMENIRYIATLYDDGDFLGNGVIINKYFVIVTYELAEPLIDADLQYFFVSAGYLVPMDSWPDDYNGIFRDIHEAYLYDSYDSEVNPYVGNIGLLRACPSFPPEYFGQVPIAIGIESSDYRDVATEVAYYNLETEDQSGDSYLAMHVSYKNIAEKCECLYDTEGFWNSEYHICMQYSSDVFAWYPEDKDGVIVTEANNNEILGILMTFEDEWGEVALWLHQEDQKSWIDTTSVTDPFEYPPE